MQIDWNSERRQLEAAWKLLCFIEDHNYDIIPFSNNIRNAKKCNLGA